MRCRGYAISHIGNSRENHEDNYLLGKQYLLPEQVAIFPAVLYGKISEPESSR